MPSIAKKLVTNEARQIIAIQIDYADWLKMEPLFNEYSKHQEKATHLNQFRDFIPSAEEFDEFPTTKSVSSHQRVDPDKFLARIEAIHKQMSHLPPLTDEILEMAKKEGRK